MDDYLNKESTPPYSPLSHTHIIRVDSILLKGLALWKIPFHTVGNPQRRFICIKQANTTNTARQKEKLMKVQVLKTVTSAQMENVACPMSLELTDSTKANTKKQIAVKDIMDIKEGHTTNAFQAFKARNGVAALPLRNLCFSIICSERTYDLYTDSPSLTCMVIDALRRLLNQFSTMSSSQSLQALTIANLRSNFDPNLNERHFFAAAKAGDTKSFLWHVEHGMAIDTMESNERKDTPLIAACRLGRTGIVKIALQFNAKNDPHPTFGQTALQVAVASGHVDCARMILETAAESDVNHIISNHEDFNKEAPIHVASRCGNVSMLELLFDNGANASLVDGKGRTCLHCAAQSGNNDCLLFLLFTGCSTMLEIRDDQGYTPLHVAVKGNKIECVQSLLEHGADVDLLTIDGKRSVELAGRSEKMHQLLRRFSSRLPPVDIVSFERDDDHHVSNDNLFEGLSLFNISGGVRIPQGQSSHLSMERVSGNYSTWGDIRHTVNDAIGFTRTIAADQRFNEDHEDHTFYFNNEYWYICYNSEYHYFVRDVDQHSQWYDPRVYGVIYYHENEVAFEDDVQESYTASDKDDMHNSYNSTPHHSSMTPPRNILENKPEYIRGIKNSSVHVSVNEYPSTSSPSYQESHRSLIDDEKYKHEQQPWSSTMKKCNYHATKTPAKKNSTIAEIDVDLEAVKPKVDLRKSVSNGTVLSSSSNISKYQKMVAVGIPIGSVVHKMKVDGVHKNEIDSFIINHSGQEEKRSDQLGSLDDGRTINNTQDDRDGAVMPLPNPNLQHASLSSKEIGGNLDLSKYKKMVAVGIPIDSVAHKMKVDGVDQDQINVFCLNNGKSDRNSRNLIKPNVDKSKTYDGDCHSSADFCKVRFESDKELEKYRKMVSVGVPHQSVANKMRQEGVDAKKIDDFEITFGLKTNIAKQAHGGQMKEKVDSKAMVEECKLRIENEKTLLKYRKMASVGVPHQSIANKMRQEGVDKKLIEDFEIAYGLITAPRRNENICTSNGSRSLPLPIPPPAARRTSVKMQKIHWKAVSEEKVSNSLWADETNYESDIDEKEVRQLESLFGETKPKSKPAAVARSNSNKAMNLCLIDMKRANNVAISLAQYKVFKSYDDLCSAVVSMDSSQLTTEHLLNMKALLPTADEMRKMASYEGGTEGLGRAELFFLSVSKFPRFAQKLETFVFSLQFNFNVGELKESLHKLKNTCDKIVNNKKLAAILRKLLAVGNLVNEGAGKPRARGITVDSLLKTAKRTGSDGKTTVIYIVIANFLKQDETGSSVDFWTEIETLRDASRVDMKDCRNSFKEIEMGLKRVNISIEKEILESDNSKFLHRSSEFVLDATKTVNSLEEKISEVEASVRTLCSFFAEDPKSCQVSSIFSLLLDFSKLVRTCKETYQRNARAQKRKVILMNTPIKVSRPSPSPMKRENINKACNPNKSIDKALSFIAKAKSNITTLKSNVDETQWDDNS